MHDRQVRTRFARTLVDARDIRHAPHAVDQSTIPKSQNPHSRVAFPSSNQSVAMSTPIPTGLSHHDPLFDDASLRHKRLASDGQRLFSPSNDISIDILDVLKAEPEGRWCQLSRAQVWQY